MPQHLIWDEKDPQVLSPEIFPGRQKGSVLYLGEATAAHQVQTWLRRQAGNAEGYSVPDKAGKRSLLPAGGELQENKH